MSETFRHSGGDDWRADLPEDSYEEQRDVTEQQSDQTQEEGNNPSPGDPSLEEMLRRALNSGKDDTPPPEEPFYG